MSFLDNLFNFGSSSSSQSTNTKQNVNKNQTTTSTQNKTSSQTGSANKTQTSTTSLLDQGTQDLLKNLVQQIGTNVNPNAGDVTSQVKDLASQLVSRAQGSQDYLNSMIQSIIAEAQRAGQQTIGQNTTNLANAVGSSQNTYVAGANDQAAAQLHSQLADLAAKLGLQNYDTQTQGLAQAFSSLASVPGVNNSTIQPLIDLVQQLHGATQTTQASGQTNTTQNANSSMTANEVMNLIANAVTNGTTNKNTTSFGIKL